MELTDHGLKNSKKVLALFFEYIRKVKDEWLANGQTLDLFNETKLMSQLNYDVYTPPDQEENTCMLAQAMFHTLDPSQIVKQVFSQRVIDEVDLDDIKSLLNDMTYEKAKIVFIGNDLLTKTELLPKAISK